MKKPLLILFVLSIFILGSCNRSVKGKWSESDKNLFRKEMSEAKELSVLGENKSKWIECYLSKCEINYSCYNDANTDHDGGCEKLALACNKEIFANGSELGNWSVSDKEKFRKDMLSVEELSVLGTKKEKWVECYLSKCEAVYSSYYEADANSEGCRKIALECNNELNEDKQKHAIGE